jgi:hypothetical protein
MKHHDSILDFHEFCLLVTDLTVQSFKKSRHPNQQPVRGDDGDDDHDGLLSQHPCAR